MSPMQQIFLGLGAVATKTYVDDVFSTFVYTGTGSSQSINNGLDLSGEGGMTWIKARSLGTSHIINDTVRGAGNRINSNNNVNSSSGTAFLSSFNSNGFTIGNDNDVSYDDQTFASWSFRKAPGFFTIKEYTGSGSTQSLTHDLGSIPGCIMVKRTDSTADWGVYHRGQNGGVDPEDYRLRLNSSTTENNDTYWGDTAPTATHFTVGDAHQEVNLSGATYIAYVFAGGESTAATARSVDFDGTGDDLTLASSTDLDMGTGDFTVEFWYKGDSDSGSYRQTVIAQNTGWGSGFNQIRTSDSTHGVNKIVIFDYDATSSDALYESNGTYPPNGQWRHVAVVRASSVLYVYVDGVLDGSMSYTGSFDLSESNGTMIGHNPGDTGYRGNISNLRVVKGTAVYTSSFRPPTEPLTNITNTKLLCCNNSSTTGSTVTPGTITANGDPTASTDSPFDDPAGFVFGDAGDQNVIKNGSYVGDGTKNHDIYLGWEPSWIMIKCTNASENWLLFDVMRGIVTGGNDGKDAKLYPNTSDVEVTNTYNLEVTPTGFKLTQDQAHINVTDNTYIFTAIRRSDGYVGKPPELGTGVFGLGTRSGSSSNALSNVNVFTDFSIIKRYNNGGEYWATNARLTGKYSLQTNSTDGQLTGALPTSGGVWDYMAGHLVAASNGATNTGSDIIDYGWKRHAGFDVVAYKGSGLNAGEQQDVPHSMNKTPEMIWVKIRDAANQSWMVYHKGLNGGTNPEQYKIELNSTGSDDSNSCWDNTAPTATNFRVGNQVETNHGSYNFIAMLFASVDGISKVGSYTGNATDTDPSSGTNTITFGFAPRFVIIKSIEANTGWVVLDTLRGWTDSDSRSIRLDRTNAQDGSDSGYGYATSTGMVLTGGPSHTNYNNYKYIYYAHA